VVAVVVVVVVGSGAMAASKTAVFVTFPSLSLSGCVDLSDVTKVGADIINVVAEGIVPEARRGGGGGGEGIRIGTW